MRIQTMLKECLGAVLIIALVGLTYWGGWRMLLWSVDHYHKFLTLIG